MSLYFALLTVENNDNKKSVKFQGHMLNFCGFIQVNVFSTNHHLKMGAEEIWSFILSGSKRVLTPMKGSRQP